MPSDLKADTTMLDAGRAMLLSKPYAICVKMGCTVHTTVDHTIDIVWHRSLTTHPSRAWLWWPACLASSLEWATLLKPGIRQLVYKVVIIIALGNINTILAVER